MKEYKIAKKRIDVSVGESVRIIRELREMSQNDLAKATGCRSSDLI
jgi:transcriptional regulator with XRE-family HTH domain